MTGHLRWTIIVQLRIVRDCALTTRYNSPALTFGSFTRMRTAVRTRTRPELLKYPLNAGILITGADDRITSSPCKICWRKPAHFRSPFCGGSNGFFAGSYPHPCTEIKNARWAFFISGADDRIRTGDIWYHKPTL